MFYYKLQPLVMLSGCLDIHTYNVQCVSTILLSMTAVCCTPDSHTTLSREGGSSNGSCGCVRKPLSVLDLDLRNMALNKPDEARFG